jgi:8-oxo-dGTP diphosphatase
VIGIESPVPIVRVIVINEAGQILLLRRAEGTAGAGQWCLPGGKLDYGETAEAAAARELMEETGLKWESGNFVLFQDSLPISPGAMHCINLYFLAKVSGELTVNEESLQATWFDHESLESLDIAFRNGEALDELFQGGTGGTSTNIKDNGGV